MVDANPINLNLGQNAGSGIAGAGIINPLNLSNAQLTTIANMINNIANNNGAAANAQQINNQQGLQLGASQIIVKTKEVDSMLSFAYKTLIRHAPNIIQRVQQAAASCKINTGGSFKNLTGINSFPARLVPELASAVVFSITNAALNAKITYVYIYPLYIFRTFGQCKSFAHVYI